VYYAHSLAEPCNTLHICLSVIALLGLKWMGFHIYYAYKDLLLQLGKSEVNLKHSKYEKQVPNEA